MAANWNKRFIAVLTLCVSAAVSAEDGVTDKLILIGQTAALTGQVAGAVKEMNEGARAYIDSVNRAGGVHGRKIEIRTLDDRFDPDAAAANAEKLVRQERVFAMFLNRATPHTEAILPVLISVGVPLVAPSTGAAVFHSPVNRLLLSTPLGQEFKAVAAAHGATVSYAAMEGFVAAKVQVEGLRRAGRNLTREAFIRGLESMRKVDFGGLMVTYGPDDHTGSEFVELTMIGKDGRFLR